MKLEGSIVTHSRALPGVPSRPARTTPCPAPDLPRGAHSGAEGIHSGASPDSPVAVKPVGGVGILDD